MRKENRQSNANNTISIKDVITDIERTYSYDQCIEDKRLVLRHGNVSLVEICDTKNDREMFSKVMHEYFLYVKQHYDENFNVESMNVDEFFENEILKNCDKKLPMFFAYKNNELLGTTGYRSYFEIVNNGNKNSYQEYSIRFPAIKQNLGTIGRSGVCAFFMAYLFGLKNSLKDNSQVISFSFCENRDLLFHVGKRCCFNFVGTFTTECLPCVRHDYDIFISLPLMSDNEKETIKRSLLLIKESK